MVAVRTSGPDLRFPTSAKTQVTPTTQDETSPPPPRGSLSHQLPLLSLPRCPQLRLRWLQQPATRAVTGGLAGAGIGGIVGHQSGRGLEGAAIGVGLGILSGAILGNARDREQDLYSRGYRDGAKAASTGQTSTSNRRVDTYESDGYNQSYGQLPSRRHNNSTVHVGVGYGSGYHGGGYGSIGFGHGYHHGHYFHNGSYGNRYGHGRHAYCW